jgi:UTP:GlnB (protein PII) uridylyltransferase
MTLALKPQTTNLLKHFNRSFPPFYSQFVRNEIQLQNLQLAYQLYKTHHAVIEITPEDNKSALHFAYRNRSFLLSDIFGVLAAYGLTIHSLSLYGQIAPPMLVFIKLIISRGGKALTEKTAKNVCRALREALAGRFEVEEMLAVEFNLDAGLDQVETEFYVDPVFHLPALLIEAVTQPGLLYKVMSALRQEDLLVVNANLLVWRGRTRLILYLLGPNESLIPEYLGQKIAESIKYRLMEQPV